jgi:hypothetical protein
VKRSSFDKEYIFSELDKLSPEISSSVNLFIIGGLGLIHYGLKEATKDIDVVVKTSSEFDALTESLEKLGYRVPGSVEISRPYRKMVVTKILENSDGFRWDIFLQQVCGSLTFSDAMKSRTTSFYIKGLLNVLLASKEDIFLFKSITERETDLGDMRLLAESGLNWEIIKQECQNQSLSTGRLWENALYQKLLDLKSKYGIKSPIEKHLKAIAEEKMAEIVITEEIKKGNNTVKTISKALKLSEPFVRDSLAKMEKKELLKVDRSARPYRFTPTS